MSLFSVDIESNGPIPGKYSMTSIGVVRVSDLSRTFYRELKPRGTEFDPGAVKVTGHTIEYSLEHGEEPLKVMQDLDAWLKENNDPNSKRIQMIADNAGFDWSFVNWYFHQYLGYNPFGWSCTSLTSLYKGYVKDMTKSFKHLRKTKHSHNALDDAIGNAEAVRAIRWEILGL